MSQAIDVVDEAGHADKNHVPVMVLFKPNFGWDARSNNSKLAVLDAIAEAEKPSADAPTGNPLRAQLPALSPCMEPL